MKYSFILLICFLSLETTYQQCIYSFPYKFSSFINCNGQFNVEKGQNSFPAQWADGLSPKIFSFDLQLSIPNGYECGASSPFSLFTIQLTLGSTAIKIIDFYQVDGPVYEICTEDVNGPVMILSLPGTNDLTVNKDFELAATIDLSSNVQTIKVYFAFQEATLFAERIIAVDPSWQFDASTKMYICSDTNNDPSFYCEIISFNYWFTTPSNLLSYIGSLTPLLQASYPITEGSGSLIIDSSLNLGNAYFGNSGPSTTDPTNSPSWLSTEAGVKFTSTNQFIRFKPFNIVPTRQYNQGSFTITFWFRRSPNGGGYIFRYSNNNLNYDYFSLRISDTGNLRGTIYGQSTTATTSVSVGVWKIIAATFALHANSAGNYVTINIGDNYVLSEKLTDATPAFSNSASNNVRIGGPGGFKGSIYDVRIYAPGSSAVINSATCTDPAQSSTCSISFGKLDNDECGVPSNIKCHFTCKTCFDNSLSGCLSCFSGYHLSFSQCVEDTTGPTTPTTPTTPEVSPTTTDTIKGSQKSAQVATQVVNAVTAGSPSGISAAIGGKIFFNIKFLNISYAQNLEEALTSWTSNFISLGLTPNLPSSIKDQIPIEDVPYVFDKREVPSSFLENFWESLGMLIFVAVIFLGVFVLELTATKLSSKYLPHNLLFAARAIVQNFLLAQLYSVFGDVLFFATLEFRAPNTHHKWSRLSLASGILLLAIMFVILGFHFRLLYKYQRIRKTNRADLAKFENENKGSNVLFGDFKNISLARQSFLLLLTGRDLIFSLLLTAMYEHPLIECIFILVLNLAMVTYLLLLPPFKSTFDAAQQLFYEVVTLAVNVSVLVLAIMDEINTPDNPGFRSQIGKFIIIVNMVFNFGSLVFMLVKASQTLYEIYKAYKERRNKHKVDLKIQAPDRLVKTSSISLQKAPELDQSYSKPLDLTDEDLITNKTLLVVENRPQFGHTPDNKEDERVQAIRDILEKSEHEEKKWEDQKKPKFSEPDLCVRNMKQISQNNIVSRFRKLRNDQK